MVVLDNLSQKEQKDGCTFEEVVLERLEDPNQVGGRRLSVDTVLPCLVEVGLLSRPEVASVLEPYPVVGTGLVSS
jgi:hypothetical protein